MEKEQLAINIKINGRIYPLKIDRNEEEKYRLAAKRLNEIIEKFKTLFHGKDSRDILSMAAFQCALEAFEARKSEDDTHFLMELRNLNDDIVDFLRERK